MSSPANPRQPRFTAWLALPVLAWAAACGDPVEPNRAPAAVGAIPDQILPRGHRSTLDAAGYFSDPEGGTLRYEAATSNATVVSVSASGSVLSLAALTDGTVTVIVTAIDPEGLVAQQSFIVTVPTPPMIELAADSAAAPESGMAVIELVLSAAPPTPITVTYTLGMDGDAATADADSADFADGLRGAVEIEMGAREAAIRIAFNDDEDIEPTREFFSLTLDAPAADAGYDLGTETTAVVTIQEGVCDRTPAIGDNIVAQSGVEDCAAVGDGHLLRIFSLNVGGRGSITSLLPSFDEPEIVACDADEWFSMDGLGRLRRPGEANECEGRPGIAESDAGPTPATWLAGTALETLKDDDFAGLSNLGFLLITGSELAELPTRVFSGLESLQYLVLSNNRLTALPEDVFSGLSSLQFLFLDRNGLTALPDGISDLSNLNTLVLSSNQLEALPDGMFSGLSSLQSALLDGNQLTGLPAEGPSSLQNLILSANQLTELPAGWFLDNPGLLRLYLDNNRLEELPAGIFAGLSNLLELRLSQNRLSRFPAGAFSDLVSLQDLRLFRNQLSELPEGAFSSLAGLTRLFLGQNQLSALPAGVFSGLPNLEWLALDVNRLNELPADAFAGLASLQRLWLTDNGLAELPQDIFLGLSELDFLSLAINELTELPADAFVTLPRLRILYLLENQLSELPMDLFDGLSSLEGLYLRDNELTALPEGMFIGLTTLSALSLENNPGAPFTLTMEVERADNEDLLAPSPGRVTVRLADGAPFAMRIPLSVHGGGLAGNAAVLGPGEERSQEIAVTRSEGSQSGTQVTAGPAPRTPPRFSGITVVTTDPLILFGLVSNRAPIPLHEIPWYRLRGGAEDEVVDLSSYFRDPDDDELQYEVTNETPAVASATVSEDRLIVTAGTGGATTITVTAADPEGLSARLSFPVSVRAPIVGSFDMDVIVSGEASEATRAAFQDAADWWMSILADTELPDVPVEGLGRLGCSGIFADQEIGGTIDDLLIVVVVEEVDGPGGNLASAKPCSVREGSMLPFLGVNRFDKDDLERLEGSSDLDEVILHEIGHVLGIGTIWRDFDLLRDPSLQTPGADTHFAGPLAIAAFDEAGGTNYTEGAKVPVENRAGPGSGDSHWRQSVFVTELMTPYASIGTPDALSAITIQSLADLGYTVDVSLAEPYTLPGLVAAEGAIAALIDFGDDVLKGPIVVVDRNGRVVRVIER